MSGEGVGATTDVPKGESMLRITLSLCCAAIVAWVGTARADDVLVTSLSGEIGMPESTSLLSPFVRLKPGQDLWLAEGARLKLVYLGSGREELWRGPGRLAIGETMAVGEGMPPARIRVLATPVARQLALTPLGDAPADLRPRRQRSIPAVDPVQQIEATYRQLRAEAAADDLDPELYLLSGLMENRQLDRVEDTLKDIIQKRPGDPQVKLLAALYRKSLRNARDAGKSDSTSRSQQ